MIKWALNDGNCCLDVKIGEMSMQWMNICLNLIQIVKRDRRETECSIKYSEKTLSEFISSGLFSWLLCYHCCILAAAHKQSREWGWKQWLALTRFPLLGHRDVSCFVVCSDTGIKTRLKSPWHHAAFNYTVPPSFLLFFL